MQQCGFPFKDVLVSGFRGNVGRTRVSRMPSVHNAGKDESGTYSIDLGDIFYSDARRCLHDFFETLKGRKTPFFGGRRKGKGRGSFAGQWAGIGKRAKDQEGKGRRN